MDVFLSLGQTELAHFLQIIKRGQLWKELIPKMKQNSEAERDSNVIKLSFKNDYDANKVPHDIAHPASKNYLEDDPLNQLLHEFDDLVV